jgi:single-strand DNA-binding protein
MNLNKVFLAGRLTKDPEKRELPSGTLLCNFTLATDRFWTDKDGRKKQETEFHNIVLYGKLAEIAQSYLKKGALVLIEGRLRTRNWDGNDNQKFQKTEIIVEKLQLGPRTVRKDNLPPLEDKKEEIPVVEEEIDFNQIEI